jgi:hypothetical protein
MPYLRGARMGRKHFVLNASHLSECADEIESDFLPARSSACTFCDRPTRRASMLMDLAAK